MNCISFVVLITTFYGKIRADTVNDGASTSTQQLDNCQRCEILTYAERMVRLMLAEDIAGGEIENLVQNRFNELEAFHDEIYSLIGLAEYGVQSLSSTSAAERRVRLTFFSNNVNQMIARILQRSCVGHYRSQLWYEYTILY